MYQSTVSHNYTLAAFIGSEGVTVDRIVIDTKKWSARKRNTLVFALETGIVFGSYKARREADTFLSMVLDTGYSEEQMYCLDQSWSHMVPMDRIKPEKQEDFVTIQAAKIRIAEQGGGPTVDSDDYAKEFVHKARVRWATGGQLLQHRSPVPFDIYLPVKQKREIVREYFQTPTWADKAKPYADLVKNGEKIVVTAYDSAQ